MAATTDIFIKVSVMERIRHDLDCKTALMAHFKVSQYTIERWISTPRHQAKFTQVAALTIIKSHLGLNDDEIFQLERVEA